MHGCFFSVAHCMGIGATLKTVALRPGADPNAHRDGCGATLGLGSFYAFHQQKPMRASRVPLTPLLTPLLTPRPQGDYCIGGPRHRTSARIHSSPEPRPGGCLGSGVMGSWCLGSWLMGRGCFGSGVMGSGRFGSGVMGSGCFGSGVMGSWWHGCT